MMFKKKTKKPVRKYARGGMPSIADSIESGNRVSKQVGAETKKLMPAKKPSMPPVGESVKSGNRMSKENAKDMKAVSRAKGGKVKSRYADGGPVGIESNPDEEMQALMRANLEAIRRREAEEMAAKAKPKAAPAKRAAPKVEPKSTAKSTAKSEPPAEPAVKPPAKRMASPEPRMGIQNLKDKIASGPSSAENRAKAMAGARALRDAPSRAARGLESLNDQTKMQARSMAEQRKRNPDLVTRLMEASNPYKKAKGGKVAVRGNGIAKRGHTIGKMR